MIYCIRQYSEINTVIKHLAHVIGRGMKDGGKYRVLRYEIIIFVFNALYVIATVTNT